MIIKQIKVIGRVQGVFFRVYTKKKAQELGLSGWVKNEADGSVVLTVEGPEDKIQEMVEWCREGSPLSKVSNVEQKDEQYTGREEGFKVIK